MRQRRFQLVLVCRTADGAAGGPLKETFERALSETNRHPSHEAECPAERRRLPESSLETVIESSTENVTEVDAAILWHEANLLRVSGVGTR